MDTWNQENYISQKVKISFKQNQEYLEFRLFLKDPHRLIKLGLHYSPGLILELNLEPFEAQIPPGLTKKPFSSQKKDLKKI